MKYSDLIHFDPIQTVKVLVDASHIDQAREDVATFVISDSMNEQLRDIIVPQLDYNDPKDDKGLLVVANYGTGKTHMMSVLSSVAEHAELVDLLTREETRDAMQPIAGRFKVIRAEIGATTMSLRDIVVAELEKGLNGIGVNYKFPSMEETPNTKDPLTAMMTKFEEVYPDQGLLFVLDELLDYLRSLKDADMILALRFLREIGEICRATRFRFIGGVQEAIFDNPRFANVADAVKRVKDRFEQVRISREDVAYVVQERLLKKSAEQREQITDYLQPFTPLYEGMSENLSRFVELFPVHPAYLRVFEEISAIEKREILKTLSSEMAQLLEDEVPEDHLGLVTYDSYRIRLDADPSNRQIPEVREVLETNSVLRGRVEQALPTKAYVETALRIVDALTVQRLTTGDIYVPVGVTRRELRDDLCLLPPNMPEKDAFFLETTVDSIVDQIMKAVSGQFISEDPDTHQVYLDVRKTVDYDQQIEDRAASLDADKLDEAYFHALEELLERRDQPYVSGYRIWEYELPWPDKNVTRFGYLFMGAPNERSTAQPPRDFYIYFLQPYDTPKFTDEQKPDEVFFRLTVPDDEFTAALRRYAGATAKSVETAGEGRSIYEAKARESVQKMVTWLKKNMGQAVSVTHLGEEQPLQSWLGTVEGARSSIKEQIDSISSRALTDHFASRYPGYPKFEASVTRDNIQESARQALAHIATGRKTDLSARILRSLELLDNSGTVVASGEFAKALTEQLKAAKGQVVNRSDLLQERDPGVWTWGSWQLEPIWLTVVAAALTQLGKAELGFPGKQVDALGLQQLATMSANDLEGITHVAPPKELPVTQLRQVAKLLQLPPGIVPDTGVSAEAVQQILTAGNALLERVAAARALVQGGIQLWGGALLEQADQRDAKLASLQSLLENVRARDSIGKMNKLDIGMEAIEDAGYGVDELNQVEAVQSAKAHLGDAVEYLREAAEVFGPEYTLSKDAETLREEILSALRADGSPDASKLGSLKSDAEKLRQAFADEAAKAHGRDRLDGQGEARKKAILDGPTYKTLGTLQTVSILPDGSFGSLQNRLVSIQTCLEFDESALTKSVICKACSYRPHPTEGPTAKAAIEEIERDLDKLLDEWVRTLAENLEASEMQEQIDLLADPDKVAVSSFASTAKLPDEVDQGFIKALNDVFGRFEVRHVSAAEVWGHLFPEQAPATLSEVQERFAGYLADLSKGVNGERLRIVPKLGEEA